MPAASPPAPRPVDDRLRVRAQRVLGETVDNHGEILTEIDSILEGLLRDVGASRVTLRQDLPGDYAFPVTHEALAPGVPLAARRADGRPAQPARRARARARTPGRPGRLPRRRSTTRRSTGCSRPTAGSPRRSSRRSSSASRLAAIVSLHQLGSPRALDARPRSPRARAAAARVGGAPLMHNRWHPDIAPVVEVAPGEELTLESRTGSPGSSPARARTPTARRSTSASRIRSPGPLEVAGAEPGDVLEVEFLGVRARPTSASPR